MDKHPTPSSIIAAGIIGTAAMTAFSQLISRITGQQHRENRLLDFLFDQWAPKEKHLPPAMGIMAHYGMGVVWVDIYTALLKKAVIDDRLLSSAASGAASGLIAAAGWKTMLMTAHRQPPTHTTNFLLQLIPAHVVFGMVSIQILRMTKK